MNTLLGLPFATGNLATGHLAAEPFATLVLAGGPASAGALVEPLGWTLVHFLWQAAAVAALLAVARVALRRRSANARYLAACAAMLALAVLPVVTLVVLTWQLARATGETALAPSRRALVAVTPAFPPAPGARPNALENRDALQAETRPLAAPAAEAAAPSFAPTDPRELLATDENAATQPPPSRWRTAAHTLAGRLRPALPWLVGGWCIGVLALSGYHLGGWAQARRLVRSGTRPAPAAWQERLARLATRLRVTRPVRLLESTRVVVPAVVGWLRPVVLVPASALSGLPVAQLEAVLAHELAHVRRHDYLVNLLQSAVETLLFYHPAVWWVSRQVRTDREDCCDDVAAAACGDPVLYARALATLEEMRADAADAMSDAARHPSHPALAATGPGGQMPLLRRIRRLVTPPAAGRGPHTGPERRGALPAAAVALATVTTLVVAVGISLAGNQKDADAASAKGSPDTRAEADPDGNRADAGDNAFRATFKGGGTVEVVGVSENPSKDHPWWRPDGTPLDETPPALGGGGRVFTSGEEVAREVVVRLDDMPGDASYPKLAFAPGGSSANGGNDDAGHYGMAVALPRSADTFAVKVGVASGPWKTLADGAPGVVTATGTPETGVVFSRAYEAQGSTVVTVAHNVTDDETRLVAVDADGKEHPAGRTNGGSSNAVAQVTFEFADLPLARVKKLVLQTRPYEWVTIKGVATRPGARPAAAAGTNGDDAPPAADGDAKDDALAPADDPPGRRELLSYVDDTAEGKRSIAGSGHAMYFDRKDEGAAQLTAVHVFGARYGTPQPPEEDFHVYVLDERLGMLADVKVPYKTFERGEMRWYVLKVPPVNVPRNFVVCLSFNPARMKGVYVGMDKDPSRLHSAMGLPSKGIVPIKDEYNWMMRVQLEMDEPAPDAPAEEGEEGAMKTPADPMVAEFMAQFGKVQQAMEAGDAVAGEAAAARVVKAMEALDALRMTRPDVPHVPIRRDGKVPDSARVLEGMRQIHRAFAAGDVAAAKAVKERGPSPAPGAGDAKTPPAPETPPAGTPAALQQAVGEQMKRLAEALEAGKLDESRQVMTQVAPVIEDSFKKWGESDHPPDRAQGANMLEGLRRARAALDHGDLVTAAALLKTQFNGGHTDEVRPGPEHYALKGKGPELTKEILQRADKARRQKAVDALLADLDPAKDPEVIATALAVLPAVKDVPFDRAPVLTAIRGLLGHADQDVRAGALNAIGYAGGEPSDVPAIAALASDPSPTVRARVATALYGVAGRQPGFAVFAAVDALLDDYAAAVQLNTIRALWGHPVSAMGEKMLIDLSQGFERSGRGQLAYDAVYYALTTRPSVSPAVADRLIEIMRGGERSGQAGRAAWGLSHHDVSPEARERVTNALLEELDETLDPYVRGNIVYGLGQLGGDAAVAKLKELAEKDESEPIRKRAAEALARHTG